MSVFNTSNKQHKTGRQQEAHSLYIKGNEHRQAGNFQEAMNCYLEAVHLDPDSPAATAMEMLQSVMNFYCKDYYNP